MTAAVAPEQLRCLVQDCIAKHLYTTAAFYADKLVSLTGAAPGDIYLLAQVHSVCVNVCVCKCVCVCVGPLLQGCVETTHSHSTTHACCPPPPPPWQRPTPL